MSDYGIINEGFKRKRLDLLLAELNEEVKGVFGAAFDVSPESPDGQINGIVASAYADLWEIAEKAYNAVNPLAATSAQLDFLAALNGVVRKQATKTRVTCYCVGDLTASIIPEGTLVSDNSGNQFRAIVDTVFLDSFDLTFKETNVIFEALEDGEIEVPIGAVVNIDTPLTGWQTVTNNVIGVPGSLLETDAELRARRIRSTAINSNSTVDSIYAEVNSVEGVTGLTVLENDTSVVDANGQQAHSIQVIAVGGSDSDIATAIFNKKPAGISSVGNTSINVPDSQSILHIINFTRPTLLDIYVDITLTKNSDYPLDGDDQIKQAIVDYANGDLIANCEIGLSDDVIYSRIYTPINSIKGHQIDDLRIGITASPTGTSNIAVGVSEYANFSVGNITIS